MPSAGNAPRSKKKTVRAFLEQIPADLRKTIGTFTTDMWDGYLQAADDFIQEHDDVEGEIVVDRFHVAQNYRNGFNALRKKEFKRLKQELGNECYDQDCNSGFYAKTTLL